MSKIDRLVSFKINIKSIIKPRSNSDKTKNNKISFIYFKGRKYIYFFNFIFISKNKF